MLDVKNEETSVVVFSRMYTDAVAVLTGIEEGPLSKVIGYITCPATRNE